MKEKKEKSMEERLLAGEPAFEELDPYLARIVEGKSRFMEGIIKHHLEILARGKVSLEEAKRSALTEISEEIEKGFNSLEAEK